MCGSCCVKDLRYQDGKLQMLKGNSWSDVPGEPASTLPPSLPPTSEETPPTQTIACYKANGVWEVMKAFTDALILSVTGANLTPLHPYQSFQNEYGVGLKADNFKLWEFMADHFTDDPDVGVAWGEHEETIKADFICAAQDAFSKFPILTDDDYDWIAAYDFDSPSAVLDDFMTAMLSVPETAAWAEAAGYHVFSMIGECNCTGDSPFVPDDGTSEPDAGCIKVFPAVLAFSAYDGQNFGANYEYAIDNPSGVIVTNQHGKTEPTGNNGSGSDVFQLGLMFRISTGAQIIGVRWDWSSPYTQGTAGRTYQWVLGDYDNESGASHHTIADETISAGSSGTITQAASGDWVTRSDILLSAFATATEGSLNEVSIKNVQFHIKSEADGFEGWVRAGEQLCE